MAVSVATSMIPFLEMMMRTVHLWCEHAVQAVPLLKTESPIVGTGMEYKAAVDSGVCIIAEQSGIASVVSPTKLL